MKRLLYILLLLPMAGFAQPISFHYFNISNIWDTWDASTASGFIVFSQANTIVSISGASGGIAVVKSTVAMSSGKWYCEFQMQSSATFAALGVVEAGYTAAGTLLGDAHGWAYQSNQRIRHNNTFTNPWGSNNGTAGVAFDNTNVVGMALDINNGFIYFSVGGVWQNGGVPTSGSTGTGAAYSGLTGKTLWAAVGSTSTGSTILKILSRPQVLTYAPPTGYSPGIKY